MRWNTRNRLLIALPLLAVAVLIGFFVLRDDGGPTRYFGPELALTLSLL